MDILTNAMKLTLNMKVAPGEGMWDMMKSMTLEKAFVMAGNMVPEGFAESINAKLTEIDKL